MEQKNRTFNLCFVTFTAIRSMKSRQNNNCEKWKNSNRGKKRMQALLGMGRAMKRERAGKQMEWE